jgi:transcriptional regulator with XRE-family HTH domain
MGLGAEKPAQVESGSFGLGSKLLRQIGQRIAKLRQGRGWSRGKLARELGVSRQALTNWERGENRPPYELFVALRDLFEVSIDELMTGKSPIDSVRERIAHHVAELRRIVEPGAPAEDEEE